MGPPYGKLPILFPNPTPMFESLKIWEWYGSRFPFSGVPLLGVPGITLDLTHILCNLLQIFNLNVSAIWIHLGYMIPLLFTTL